MGQILTAGQGQNPARQASIAAGIPVESPAWGVNQLCGSGLRAVALGYQAILNGDSDIVVAGGQESMSMAPHCRASAQRREDGRARDGRHHDQGRPVGRLQRLSHGHHRRERRPAVADHARAAGRVRRRLAEQGGGRAEGRQVQGRDRAGDGQDAARATSSSTPTNIRRHGATLDAMAKLRPAFAKDGTVTAGNASGINDGAAAVVLMRRAKPQKRGKTPLARIVSWAQAGVDPSIMGTGPIPGLARGAQEGRLEGRGPRSGRGQRGVRGAGLRGQQGPGLGHREGQRQWRRHRDRPPDRRLRRARADDAAATRCRSATPRRASPRSASAAAWASPCAWSGR